LITNSSSLKSIKDHNQNNTIKKPHMKFPKINIGKLPKPMECPSYN
jgi:hypothetical protein